MSANYQEQNEKMHEYAKRFPDLPPIEKALYLLWDFDGLETFAYEAADALAALRAEAEEWREYKDDHKKIMSEPCGDEVHCTCVPALQAENAELKETVRLEHEVLVSRGRTACDLLTENAELKQWKSALQNMTPTGSEFTELHECVKWMKDRMQYPKRIVELQAENERLMNALTKASYEDYLQEVDCRPTFVEFMQMPRVKEYIEACIKEWFEWKGDR